MNIQKMLLSLAGFVAGVYLYQNYNPSKFGL